MKVLHVGLETTEARHGGLNRYVEALLAAERADGLEATAVLLGEPTSSSTGVAKGVTLAGRPGRPLPVLAVDVDRAVRRLGRPDVADLHFAGTAVVTSTLGALRSVPKVVHFQGPWADESAHGGASGINVAIKRRIERRVYRRADRFVTLSTSFAELLSARYGIAPWAIDVIAPGVDLDHFGPGDKAASRASLGAPGGRIVLAVRRLVPRMGLDVLLTAWAQLMPRGDDLLAIVGHGPEEATLRSRADALGLGESVRFCGAVGDDELVRWYRAADVTAVPTVALEGFGLVLLESLACGTPVVATDVGGLPEALSGTGQAHAIPAGDAPALAAALAEGLEHADDPSVADRARRAANEFGWSAVAARHRVVYERVLAGAEVPRVVVLDHVALLSGGELAIARAIGGLGARASVFSILAEDGPLTARLEAAGSTVEVLALPSDVRTLHRGSLSEGGARAVWTTARYALALARRLRELRPDVVHTNSLKSALYGGVACRLAGVPCVWHVRDRLEPPSLPSGTTRMVRLAARLLPTVVVANSASTLATVGVPRGHVVPSPLDPSIDPRSERTEHLGAQRFTILGRLAPWKGQHLALEAFADAFPASDEVLRVVGSALFGEDEYAASLPGLAERLGIADRVEFSGFVDDVAGVLSNTDVLIHASIDPEPFGQVVIEALGAGCVVIVANTGGPAEVVTDDVDGLLYEMGDRAALAATLQRVAGDPSLRTRLRLAGQATARSYLPEALAPRLLAAWEAARARTSRRWRRRTRRG